MYIRHPMVHSQTVRWPSLTQPGETIQRFHYYCQTCDVVAMRTDCLLNPFPKGHIPLRPAP
jgi:hypothetical protein